MHGKAAVYETKKRLVLGSASPRRKDLLGLVGLEFEVIPSHAEEPPPSPDQTPADYTRHLAALKAREVAARIGDGVVIGSDTVVAVGRTILGKPRDREDAVSMLTMLSGKEHQVVTGCAIISSEGWESVFSVSTKVWFTNLAPETIRAYVATGEPMDKAGAYAIQGVGAFMVREVAGSYTNVVGLPLARVLEVLVSWDVIATRQG